MNIVTADGWCGRGSSVSATADGWPDAQTAITADGFFGDEVAGGVGPRQIRYILKVDGTEFPCWSLAEALAVLERAKALAKKISQARLRKASESRKAQKPPREPRIECSAELAPAVKETRREIKDIYAQTNRDMELMMLLHEQMLRDEDEDLMWLM